MDEFDQFAFGKSSLFRGELLVLESIMAKKHFRDLPVSVDRLCSS